MYTVRPTSIQGVSHLFAELSRFLPFYFKKHYCSMNIHLADQGSNRYIQPVSAIIKEQTKFFFLIIVAFYKGKGVKFFQKLLQN